MSGVCSLSTEDIAFLYFYYNSEWVYLLLSLLPEDITVFKRSTITLSNDAYSDTRVAYFVEIRTTPTDFIEEALSIVAYLLQNCCDDPAVRRTREILFHPNKRAVKMERKTLQGSDCEEESE